MARCSSDSLLFDPLPPVPDFAFEVRAHRAGHRAVAGVDEAGRGPLAGPVVAAAVVLDPGAIPEGLNDSKKLTAARRDALFEMILTSACVAVASTSPRQIDATNILIASLDAMRRAVAGLVVAPSHVLVDGRDLPPGLACSGEAVVKGDSRCVSIAAASIVAKVMRDRMMRRAHLLHPEYGFDCHVGYATADHRLAIERAGPCPLHRLSFGTVRRVHTGTAETEG